MKGVIYPLSALLFLPAESLKVLHVSDVHYDEHYVVGAPATCFLDSTGLGCCRKSSTPKPMTNYPKARIMGEYLCDAPMSLIEHSLKHIAQHHQVDLILWTGDNASHENHKQTPSYNLRANKVVTELFDKYFPDTVIVPALGNHDGWPVNQLSFRSSLNKWLLGPLAESWPKLLRTDPEQAAIAHDDFLNGGYFIFSPLPGLKIMSINCLLFSSRNKMTKKWEDNPDNHRDWAQQHIELAARQGEKVWIVAHFSKDAGDANTGFTIWMQEMLDKYPETLTGHFAGHTHRDDNGLYRFSPKGATDQQPEQQHPGQPLSPFYVGPSLVPDRHEPAFRIYEVDDVEFGVKNYVNYATDLNMANTLAEQYADSEGDLGENVPVLVDFEPRFDLRRDAFARLRTRVSSAASKNVHEIVYLPEAARRIFASAKEGKKKHIPEYMIRQYDRGVFSALEFEMMANALGDSLNNEVVVEIYDMLAMKPEEDSTTETDEVKRRRLRTYAASMLGLDRLAFFTTLYQDQGGFQLVRGKDLGAQGLDLLKDTLEGSGIDVPKSLCGDRVDEASWCVNRDDMVALIELWEQEFDNSSRVEEAMAASSRVVEGYATYFDDQLPVVYYDLSLDGDESGGLDVLRLLGKTIRM